MRGRVSEIEKVWLSPHEAEAYLGVSGDFIKAVRDAGRLQFYKPFGQKMIFYKKSDLDRFIEKGKQL